MSSTFYFFLLNFIFLLFYNIINGDQLNNKVYWFSILILICISGFRTNGIDYQNYLLIYNERSLKYLEPGIIIIRSISKLLTNNPTLFFLLFSILGVGLKAVAIKKITNLRVLTLLVYSSYYFLYHDLIQIRTGVASGMLLILVMSVCNNRKAFSLIYLTIAILFHVSSLSLILIYFLNYNKINKSNYYLLITISYLVTFLNINFSHFISYINLKQINLLYNSYLNSTSSGLNDKYLNLFSFIQIIRLLIVLSLIYFSEVISNENKYFILLLKIYIYSIVFYNIFADLPVVSVRLSQLFGVVEIVLIPFIIYIFNFKSRIISQIIPITISVFILSILLFYRNILSI